MSEIKLSIDGREVTGQKGQTILDIARENNIEIPTLCHDDRVEVFGSCGLCVVEVEGSPRLFRACATAAADGMKVITNSDRVVNNRKAALELLLSDHIGDCRAPCQLACPGQTDCQGYVGLIANGSYDEAYKLIKDKIPLPASIGRVCPHPCEDVCRRMLVEEPISIAALKQFAADTMHDKGSLFTAEVLPSTGKNIAIIGGGPGGLTAAYFLRAKGHAVTIYDAMPLMGGMLRYGIPEYRLPKKVLQEEIDTIANMGVELINNVRIGKDITMGELQKKNDAVIIAIGAWSSTGMNVKGEDLDGVHGGIEFLWNITGITESLLRRRVAIVGGGNTAMDACRTAVRSGASVVYNIYRRTRNEMPAEKSEIDEAEEEGVIFKNLTNPLEIIGENGKVKSIRLQIMELGEPDASGRRSPVPVEGQEESIDVDVVIMAIGQKPDTKGFDGIDSSRWGTIIADEVTFRTNIEGVFAIGDATNDGADIAITAIGEAKRASEMVDRYLMGEALDYKAPFLVKSEMVEEDFVTREKISRAKMPHRSAADRKKDFLEINYGLNEDEAKLEASRCLECGCMDYFECKLVNFATKYQIQPEKFSGQVHRVEHEDKNPHIRRNPEKCILCGLCVRICEQVSGASAIGFMERGFDTIVKPAFDRDLADTDCTSCGQCIYVCPTGALTEVLFTDKQIPLDEELTESVCSFCSVGCKVRIGTNGTVLTRTLPSTDKDALLCKKGRFGLEEIKSTERIQSPLMRTDTGMEECEIAVAIGKVNSSLKGIQEKYGNDSIAVAVSSSYTNEEAYLIKEYANNALNTDMVFSLNQKDSGLIDVLGCDCSTGKISDMSNCNLIVAVELNSDTEQSTVAMRIRSAVRDGSKLMLLTSRLEESLLKDIASVKIKLDDNLDVFNQITKSLLDSGYDEGLAGLDELRESLKSLKKDKAAADAVDTLVKAEKTMFIFEKNTLTAGAARAIANIAVLTGNSERIIQLLPDANSQGLVNLGYKSKETLSCLADEGKIHGLLLFGEDIGEISLRSVEFLAVHDLKITDAARQADVVFPSSSYVEKDGSFTSSDNKTQSLSKSVQGTLEMDSISLFKELSTDAGVPMKYKNISEIQKAVVKSTVQKAKTIKLAAAKKDNLLR